MQHTTESAHKKLGRGGILGRLTTGKEMGSGPWIGEGKEEGGKKASIGARSS